MGAVERPAFPAPSAFLRDAMSMQDSGVMRGEKVKACLVIAIQRVRAERGPMTGSAKQSRVFPR
jgi:hypothetical protein